VLASTTASATPNMAPTTHPQVALVLRALSFFMSHFVLTTVAARRGPKRTAASCEAADQYFGRECGLLRKERHDCLSGQGEVCGCAAWHEMKQAGSPTSLKALYRLGAEGAIDAARLLPAR
jgi:hypothetical protein